MSKSVICAVKQARKVEIERGTHQMKDEMG